MEPVWSPGELELLGNTFLFRGVERAAVLRAASDPRCSRESFTRGAQIYSPRRFRRILAGRVRVTKGELVVSTLGPGELFGAAALFHDRPDYETTLTALSPCSAAFFPQEQVAELLRDTPGAAANYIRYLSGRIHFLSRKIEGLTAPGAAGKLARCLLAEGGVLSCTATELARRLDVSRASLYRAFDALERTGAIRRTGKRIEVLSTAELEAAIETEPS